MRTLALLLATLVATAAFADYDPTRIQWPGWTVVSSEDRYAGAIHRAYPLTHLFDGNPATTWAYSGKGVSTDWRSGFPGKYSIGLRPGKPVTLDQIWIMNGYAKSEDLFRKNSRFLRLAVYDGTYWQENRTLVARVDLEDRMGWHKVSLPRRAYEGITLVLEEIRRGPAKDICVSEIALYDRGTKVDMKMPAAVVASDGSECGCCSTAGAMSRSGASLAAEHENSAGTTQASPNGAFIAGVGKRGANFELFVVDAKSAKVLRRVPLATYEYYELAWQGPDVVVTGFKGEKGAPRRIRVG
jgi:hypothetical protein